MHKFLSVLFFVFTVVLCKAEEYYYCLITDNDSKIAIADIDYLLASDSEPTFNVVLRNGTIVGPVAKAAFGKEADTGSGVAEHNTETISVYPNPVKQILYITCKGDNERVFDIYSLNGVLLKSIKSDGNEIAVPVDNLPKGKYLLVSDNTSLIFIKD